MGHSLQARTDLVRQALRAQPHPPGSPGEAALAETILLDRDIAAAETALANMILELAQERAAVQLLTRQKQDQGRNQQRDVDQIETELAAARETIEELRLVGARKLGEIGATVKEFYKQIDALAQTLLGHA